MTDLDVKVTVTVLEGESAGLSVELQKSRTTIGRKGADIRLIDKKISTLHAAIEISGKEVRVIDLDSRNGIRVNNDPVREHVLKNLDELELGRTKLKILIVENLDTFKTRNVLRDDKARLTDVQPHSRDIESMINDELKKFSKWDLSVEASETVVGSGEVRTIYGLEILEGPDAGRRIRIEKLSTTLGRSKADITIRDPDISRLHATIEVSANGSVVLKDLGSTNGTFVNSKKAVEVKLKHDDRIQLGSTLCRFVSKD